jgi:arsenate reductase
MTAFMDRAAHAGAHTHTIQVARAGIVPCKGCGYCETHGTCVIADDPMSTEIFERLRTADLVVAASPVFFYGITAQLKVLIDRCQTLWSRKYVYKLKDPLASTRRGLLFSVAASTGRQLFDGIHLTARYFFDAIDARFDHALTYRGVEAKGAIRGHKDLKKDIDAVIDDVVRPLLARKRVLFVSSAGTCRAPMAAAMVQRRFGETIRADDCGMEPAAQLNPAMIRFMEKNGTDMGYRRPRSMEQASDRATPEVVIVIGEPPDREPIPGAVTVNWPIAAPQEPDDDALAALQRTIEETIDRQMPLRVD